ncbi:MAG: hypothetical protein JO250_20755 [Armatimonadetes bacterium]|nr:hypothetical protein [Armatimonadota bacterium]
MNPAKVASPYPGYCFLKAGWHRCGRACSRCLLILEAVPPGETSRQGRWQRRTPGLARRNVLS